MPDDIITEVSTFQPVSLLEKIIGKRQSIIFSLLIAAFCFTYMGESQVASVLIGAVILVVNDYVKDVNEERKAV
jgi:hypothetical protein